MPSEDEIPKPWLSVASLYRCESCDVASTIMAESKPSPPPSPSTLLKAQIIITKAAQELEKAKAKKARAAKSFVEKENKGKNGKGTRKVAVDPVEGKVKNRRSISIS